MKISLITVCRNVNDIISETIESALSQHIDDLEYIVVDGNSTDGTVETIRSFMGRGITHFISEPDSGLYDALNKGIAVATGDVVGILHAGDRFFSEYSLSNQVRWMFENKYDAAYSDVLIKYGPILRRYNSGSFTPSDLSIGQMPAHTSLTIKRAVFDQIGVYDTYFEICSDFDFFVRLFSYHSYKIGYFPTPLTLMRPSGKSGFSIPNLFRMNREIIASCRKNGIITSDGMLYLRYVRKLREICLTL